MRRKRDGENSLVFEPDEREYSELIEGLYEMVCPECRGMGWLLLDDMPQ